MFKRHLLSVFLIAVAALLVYSNTFHATFLFDDIYHIVENYSLRSLNNLPGLLMGQRGAAMLTFSLNYAFGGLNVLGYHLVNIAVHIINGILAYSLVYLTLDRIGYERAGRAALYTALLFVLHPVQTQAVTYIIQRMESLASLFYLLSILLFVMGANTKRRVSRFLLYSGVVVSYILGFFSKEIAVTIPFMILLYDFYFVRHGEVKDVLKRWPLYLVLFFPFIYFAGRTILTLGGLNDLGPVSAGFGVKTITPLQYLFTEFNVVMTYLRLLAFPMNQSLDYDYPISKTLFEFPTLFSFLVISAMLTLAFVLYMRSRGRAAGTWRLTSFFILWFFIILAPTSSFIPIIDVIFEHRAYLPSLGFMAITAILIDKAAGRTRGIWVASAILILLGVLTYNRNYVWRDGHSVWSDVVKKMPRKGRAHYNLACYITDLEEKIKELKVALYYNPVDDITIFHLAKTYYQKGDFDQANYYSNYLLERYPKNKINLNNLGILYFENGDYERAKGIFEELVKADPTNPKYMSNLGSVYDKLGESERAIEVLTKATTIATDYVDAYYNLGLAYKNMGRYEDAVATLKKGMGMDRGKERYHFGLGVTYYGMGDYRSAVAEFKRAAEINPKNIDAYYNLAHIYAEMMDREASLVWLERAASAGFKDFEAVMEESAFAPLTGDNRFIDLIGRRGM